MAADDLVLPGLGDEVVQALPEFIRAIPCCIDICNTDPLVWFGEGLVVLPCGLVLLYLIQDVLGEDIFRLDQAFDLWSYTGVDHTHGIKPNQAFDIGSGVRAAFSPWGETSEIAFPGDACDAVYPPKAEGLFDSVIVGDAGLC